MAKQRIKLEVEGLKLEPLKFFMAKENKDLEQEIEEAFDKLYEKYVPAQTREYIGFQLGETVQDEPSAPATRGNNPKRSRRQARTDTPVQNQNEGNSAAETVNEELVLETGMTQQL